MNTYLKEILIKNSVSVNEHNILRYLKFIEFCKKTEPFGYTEKHHIVPKSFGGNNASANLIKLSARQHYIAHLILAKATKNPKMIKALHRMVHSKTGDVTREYIISSRVYAFLREEHTKIVSQYSKNTVVAKQIYTEEITRIPKSLFERYKGILYEAISKGRKDSPETTIKKKEASRRPRKVVKGLRSRSLAATKYSYETPNGFCENRKDLLNLYPSLTVNTLTLINKDSIITKKLISLYPEFASSLGKHWSEIGFIKIGKK
jgi:hypothetical protein